MGVITTGILGGMQAGEGQNSIGEYIKGILATANKKGMIQAQAQGNIQLARETAKAKALYEPSTKNIVKVGEGGTADYVTGPGGEIDFPKGATVITPREGLTEGERNLASEKAQRKADRLRIMREEAGGTGNVVEQSFQNRSLSDATAGGMATSTVENRKQAAEWLRENGAPVTEGNIQAVIQRMGL